MKLKKYFPNTPTCRYCLEEAKDLITPCSCKGSLRYVHKKCLMEWFQTKKELQCELCKTDFSLKVKGVKSPVTWIFPKIIFDDIFFLFVIAFIVLSLVMLPVGYLYCKKCYTNFCIFCYCFVVFATLYLPTMFVYLKIPVTDFIRCLRVNLSWEVVEKKTLIAGDKKSI